MKNISNHRWLRWTMLCGGATLLFTLPAFVTFSGNPRWALNGGFHYVADLNTTSFPASSVWDANAQYALSDWRDIGSTSFVPGYTRTNSDYNDHGNGRNSWVWLNRPTDGWLAVTYVRWNGSNMTDCDIWFNSRPDYLWTNGLFDPCADRPYWPIEFRTVARHETGHAIGLDHENTRLANMNAVYDHSSEPHVQSSGMMPHADDKAGSRYLYPGSGSTVNVMATCWREPAVNSGQPQRLTISGTYNAGVVIAVPFFLENQSNVTVPGFAGGVRVGIYLSTNTLISTSDTKIAEYYFTGDWPAHASSYYSLNATIPLTMPTGAYHVGVIFDNTGIVSEQFESDNAARIGQINVLNHHTGTLTPFGTGCRNSGLKPVISASAPGGEPNIGTTATYFLSSARANAPAVLEIGLSRTVLRGLPLPFDLGVIGMPGCWQYQSDDIAVGVTTNGGGGASVGFPYPNNRSLIDVHAYQQFAIIDPGANALGIAATGAIDTKIGGNF